ncbi:hypothetical protein [Lentzea sp. E54]|uniref:hypothetical protein n=1 Tax=Lentzea xerophila TaxID=3435883 RepID=UPI003DA20683
MTGTHHLYSRGFGANAELSADTTRENITVHVHEPSDQPEILGRRLVSVSPSRFDADRYVAEVSHDL